jgi:hypothetical protein
MAVAAEVEFLVTGDAKDLLHLESRPYASSGAEFVPETLQELSPFGARK